MSTLKTIRKRILSVKNTQKITKAMKMVAAAKLRRAQHRLIQMRPYAEKMEELVSAVSLLAGDHHPLLKVRENPTRAEFLILSSDRGLCGGFNGNLLRQIENFLKKEDLGYSEMKIHVIGKKGRDFFRARHRELASVQTGLYESFNFEKAQSIAQEMIDSYLEGKFDHYYLVSNRFKSAIAQEIRIDRILPIEKKKEIARDEYVPEYLYEPGRDELLNQLMPRTIATEIYRAFLESMAAELGARMAAMENATNNCSDLIYRLTLQLNRVRQAAITKELMDIVNGAEALK